MNFWLFIVARYLRKKTMFYHLLYPLRDILFVFNVFRYITFRAAGAAVTAFVISIAVGPWLIKKFSQLQILERIRKDECPHLYLLHRQKENTPTMGGILILLAIVVSTLLWADFANRYILLVLFSTLWLGIIGFTDDYVKLFRQKSGLGAMTKLMGQLTLALVVGTILFCDPNISRALEIPFFKSLFINLGTLYIFFVVLVIMGSSNAVNLTDGLDGLAIGCVLMVALAFCGFSYVSGHINFSRYLGISYIPGAGELTVFCASIVGAGLGFLWFNAYPATIFMGDTGSLALGGAIGVISLLIKKELLLLLVGGIFVVEALSVLLQVISYRTRGKRIFLVAPLHHHFQLRGWPESKVTIRFWIVAAVLVLLSLASLKLR